MAQRVAQQVTEDLIEPLLIAAQSQRFGWQHELQTNLLLLGFDEVIGVQAFQQVLHDKIYTLEPQLASLGQRQQLQILDQFRQ